MSLIHVLTHPRIVFKITLHISLRLPPLNVQLIGQAKSRHAIDEAKVNGLGTAPLLPAHLIKRHAEHFSRGGPVHILVLIEGLQQARIPREMRHDAQFYLRVVGGHEFVAGLADKGLTDAPPGFSADGNVLQIRVNGRQAPGCRHGLLQTGVDATAARVYLLRQFVGVGRFEFAQGAMIENEARQVVVRGQFLQHRFCSGGLAGFGLAQSGQLQFVVENHLQLFW